MRFWIAIVCLVFSLTAWGQEPSGSECDELSPAAEQHSDFARSMLGLMFGKRAAGGLERLREQAAEGDTNLQIAFGRMYNEGLEGLGVEQDDAEAVRWFRLAAVQGRAMAQRYLGDKYAKGQGVSQDAAEAAKWYHLAAEQCDAEAQSNLGAQYDKAQGVSQDAAEAAKWYRLAAEQGEAEALAWLREIAERSG